MMKIIQMFKPGMSCNKSMEAMQSYLDGEIDDKQGRKVARHLARCSNCDLESKVYAKIKESLANRKQSVDPEILEALRQFSQDLIE